MPTIAAAVATGSMAATMIVQSLMAPAHDLVPAA
jgi:hypothetical protein